MSSSKFEDAVPYLTIVLVILVNLVLYLANENSILKSYINLQGKLLRVTNSINGSRRPEKFLCWDILNPDDTVSGVVPLKVLLVYRILALVSFGFTILYQGLWGSGFSTPVFDWVTYFTNWTYVGFGLYWVSGIAVLLTKLRQYPGANMSQWTLFHKGTLLLFETVCAASIFLTLFYWAVLYDGNKVELDNIMRHGVNVVTMLVELLMNRFPIVSYHLQVAFAYVTIYAIFQWVYYGISNDWIYNDLNWNNETAIVYYITVPLLTTLSFFIMYAVAWFREAIIVRIQRRYTSLKTQEVEMSATMV